MFKVKITPRARNNLNSILKYISNFSPHLANEVNKSFYEKLILIEQFPRIYKMVSYRKSKKREYRGFYINKYIVIYFIRNNLVQIVRVIPCKSKENSI